MTWSQFLYRTSTILDVQNNCFIVPILDEFGNTDGIFPVLPTSCELRKYNDVPYLRYQFRTGKWGAIELYKCGILTKYQYSNDFFGEKNKPLIPTMELINITNQGIEEATRSAATYRFMAVLSNFSKESDLIKERESFSKKNFGKESTGGILLFPNTYKDIKQIESKPYVVNQLQMEAVKENVFNYFGVNKDILQNKAVGDSWSAFYEGAIEPFSIQLSEVLTKMLFTLRERSSGNSIIASANRLQYMTFTEKLNFTTQMSDRGQLNVDEVREVWNLPPLPDGKGQIYTIRGEYKNADENQTTEENENE